MIETVSPDKLFFLQYEKVEKIGEGTYGVVYKALDKHTGQYSLLARMEVALIAEFAVSL